MLVELLMGMMSIGTPSKRMRCECWSFFFSSLFGALCQRGRKLEGSTTFSMPWRRGCYNQALIVDFGENDHAIRELMRFIEMTSREFIFENATRNEGAHNCKFDGFKLKGGLNSFIF